MEDLFFEIKESDRFLKLTPVKSNFDGFFSTTIEVKAGIFSGIYKADFMSGDFELLKQGFAKLYDNLNGSFDFNTLEHDLRLKIKD
ncbi:WapI family immunity protein [Flavobacterium hauense]